MKASVCVSTSTSTGRSVSSSRYCSVCTSMCFPPSVGSGVSGFGGSFGRLRLRCCWALRSISSCSAWAVAGRICAA